MRARLRALWASQRFRQAAKGVTLGLLTCTTAAMLNLQLPWGLRRLSVVLFIAVGILAMRARPRVRQSYWVAAGLLALLSWAVAGTHLGPRLMAGLVVDDGPAPADVIVVLSASNHMLNLSEHSLQRMITGVQLLEAGYAPAIVFTGEPGNPRNRVTQLAPALMESLGIPTAAVVEFEPAFNGRMNTYWESRSILQMAAARGWRRVLLVTSPSHTYRSKLLFERTGLEVRAVPSMVVDYDAIDPSGADDRIEMFRQWVYESMALAFYRVRGRL